MCIFCMYDRIQMFLQRRLSEKLCHQLESTLRPSMTVELYESMKIVTAVLMLAMLVFR